MSSKLYKTTKVKTYLKQMMKAFEEFNDNKRIHRIFSAIFSYVFLFLVFG